MSEAKPITQRRPAVVAAEHPTQRYYSESAGPSAIRETDQPHCSYRSSVDVLRYAAHSAAAVRIDGPAFHARILLTPTDLRRLASDLLDAADDIEQNPAQANLTPVEKVAA